MKKTLLTLALLFTIVSYAQERVSVSIHQDFKLAFIGDNKSYEAGTIDVILRLKMQGNQQKHGYMVVMPEFEYAELIGIYRRYSANIGYTFNTIVKDFEASLGGGYGFIDRFDKSMSSFNGYAELSYKINDRFKVSLLSQFTERKDIELWRYSGFIGLEINL